MSEGTAALHYLAARGGLTPDDFDTALLQREIPREEVNSRGGIRNTLTGQVIFIEAITCRRLNEAETRRSNLLLASAYRGFYEAAADGIALTDVQGVREWFGSSVEESYPEAGASFLRFATTYWTLKVILRQLDLERPTAHVSILLGRIDSLLGDLFFPFPYDGPLKIDAARREADQRRFLEAFGPRIDTGEFLRHNPILIRDRMAANARRGWRYGIGVLLSAGAVGLLAAAGYVSISPLVLAGFVAGAFSGYRSVRMGRVDGLSAAPVSLVLFLTLSSAVVGMFLDRSFSLAVVFVAISLVGLFSGVFFGITIATFLPGHSRA